MISKTIYITFICLFSFIELSYSQNYSGYYGKRNFVEITSVSYSPLVRNLLNKSSWGGYEKVNNDLLIPRGKTWLKSGVHVSLSRVIKNNVSVGFEYGVDICKMGSPTLNDYKYWGPPYYMDNFAHEQLTMIRTLYMPKIELTNGDGLLPMGISHTIGIGFSSAKIREKDYLMLFKYEGGYMNLPEGVTLNSADYIDYASRYRGLQLLYGLKMRYPVSKHLFINYGVRYKLDIRFFDIYAGSDESSSLKKIVKDNLFFNFICFDLGVSVPF